MSRPNNRKNTSRLATVGVAGVLYFALTLVAMHFIQPELDPIDHTGSEYATGRLGWLMDLAFLAAGASIMATAVGLHRSLAPGRHVRTSVALLAVVGIGFAASGVFPADVPRVDGTVAYTFSGKMHALAGFLAFLSLIVGTSMLGGVFARDARWRSSAGITRWFARLILLGFISFMVAAIIHPPGTGGMAGLVQRIFVSLVLTWLVVLAVGLRRVEEQA